MCRSLALPQRQHDVTVAPRRLVAVLRQHRWGCRSKAQWGLTHVHHSGCHTHKTHKRISDTQLLIILLQQYFRILTNSVPAITHPYDSNTACGRQSDALPCVLVHVAHYVRSSGRLDCVICARLAPDAPLFSRKTKDRCFDFRWVSRPRDLYAPVLHIVVKPGQKGHGYFFLMKGLALFCPPSAVYCLCDRHTQWGWRPVRVAPCPLTWAAGNTSPLLLELYCFSKFISGVNGQCSAIPFHCFFFLGDCSYFRCSSFHRRGSCVM